MSGTGAAADTTNIAAAAGEGAKGAAASGAGADAAKDKGAAAGATAAAAKAAPTILEGGAKAAATATEDGSDTGARAAAAATWPDDWRQQMAGGNADVEKMLKRYSSPGSVANALKSLRSNVDSGEYVKPLPADATADEVAAWRKDNGVPDKAEGYELPKGLEIDDVDKPIVDSMLTFMHNKNMKGPLVTEMVDQFFKAREQENTQAYEADMGRLAETEDALRAEYGPEYRGIKNGIKAFIDTQFGADVGAAFLGARLADGSLAFGNAGFIKPFVQIMHEINPVATLTLPNGDRGGKGVDAQIAAYEAEMATDIAKWQSNANQAKQDDYRKLIEMRSKLNARKAA